MVLKIITYVCLELGHDVSGGELLEQVLVGDGGMVDGTRHGAHSQTAILNLVDLVHGGLRRVLGETERVELEVSWLTVGLAVEHLEDGRHGHDLEEGAPQEDLGHGAGGDTPVMTVDGELGSSGIEGEGVDLGNEKTQEGKHANAAVLDLSLL